MKTEDEIVIGVLVKSGRMRSMLQRVANELNDPPYDYWGDGDYEDADLLDALCKDVEKLLEEM